MFFGDTLNGHQFVFRSSVQVNVRWHKVSFRSKLQIKSSLNWQSAGHVNATSMPPSLVLICVAVIAPVLFDVISSLEELPGAEAVLFFSLWDFDERRGVDGCHFR